MIETIDHIRAQVPDEFLTEFEGWVKEIEATVQDITTRANEGFRLAPKVDRKTLALWVKHHSPDIAHYIFALADGRDITPLIYKGAFRNRTDEPDERQPTATEPHAR